VGAEFAWALSIMQLALSSARRPAASRGAGARLEAPGAAPPILPFMVLAIVAVAAVALWDEERESSAALQDFGEEQAELARSSAVALAAHLESVEATVRALVEVGPPTARDVAGVRVSSVLAAPAEGQSGEVLRRVVTTASGQAVEVAVPVATLAGVLRRLERPGALRVLLQVPGRPGFVSTADASVGLASSPLEAALARHQPWVRLERQEAAALGLPARTAMAGLASVDGGALGAWGVVVLATALHERDREARALLRLVLSFSLASGLVLAFGGLARSKQRKEVELARHLALAEAASERDAQLVRADKLATLGALGTGIAHEVSTPLSVIVALAEQLLPRVQGDARAGRSVLAMLEQANRIGRVIRGFLGLARGGTPALEHVSPGEVAQAARQLVEHRFARAGVGLIARVDETLPPIACDPPLFEQALVNLLLNACDACQPGGRVELVVSGDQDRVGFIVLDDGAGIAAVDAKRAMEPFFTTKAGEGAGLGLAIANEIVKHHHGELSLSPRSTGRGTRAVIELDVAARVHG
jgi:two-component system, NtrC family, sensor kinase